MMSHIPNTYTYQNFFRIMARIMNSNKSGIFLFIDGYHIHIWKIKVDFIGITPEDGLYALLILSRIILFLLINIVIGEKDIGNVE